MSGVEVIGKPDLSGKRLLSPSPTTASCTHPESSRTARV